MKKLINDPSAVVREMLEGIARQAPHVAILGDENVLVRRALPEPSKRPVALISGGGSGHEPAHGGYVGGGMLSAAVCGEVFTSPSTDAVLAAIHATAGENGALLIVKNYTGDRLNFGLAAELARSEGIPVEIVTVADDVSLRGRIERHQRRGIAGTVLVHKIAGAAAAAGRSLNEVAAIARKTAENLGTMGVAFDGCTLLGAEKAGFHLADDEIELGLGIHGEKGVERTAPMKAKELTETLLANIIEDLALRSGERVALLVNGLGATPEMELAIVLRDAFASLSQRNINVERAWAGTFLSALDMPGCSVSVLRLDDEMLALLDADTEARAWPGGGTVHHHVRIEPVAAASNSEIGTPAMDESGRGWAERFKPVLQAVAHALLDQEAILTELDSKAGDGDLGASMRRAAEAILTVPVTALVGPDKALFPGRSRLFAPVHRQRPRSRIPRPSRPSQGSEDAAMNGRDEDRIHTRLALAPHAPKLHRINDVASALGVSRNTIYRMVRRGVLTLVKIGPNSSGITDASIQKLTGSSNGSWRRFFNGATSQIPAR